MNKETTTEKKSPVRNNEKLGKYGDDILFPRKVEQAKREIAKYGLPDIVKKKK